MKMKDQNNKDSGTQRLREGSNGYDYLYQAH